MNLLAYFNTNTLSKLEKLHEIILTVKPIGAEWKVKVRVSHENGWVEETALRSSHCRIDKKACINRWEQL